MESYNKELSLAVDLVRDASRITEWFKTKKISSYIKNDKSPVTLADFASQIFIISKIKKNFPKDQVIAEEDASVFLNSNVLNILKKCYTALNYIIEENLKDILTYRGPVSRRQWTVDPIDGTKGYQKNLIYAIGIGFMVDSKPTICAIGAPNYRNRALAIFSAQKNHGAKLSYGNHAFTKVNVSNNQKIETFRFCHSLHYDEPWVLKFASILGITNFVQIDSMAKLCMVAEGSADIYIKPLDMTRSFTWDFLPGDLLIKEAGGKITDLRGNNIKYNNEKCLVNTPGLIASNGQKHEELISTLISTRVQNELL
jgi:3'(2'), 5'-bisphosphate nucleotidase